MKQFITLSVAFLLSLNVYAADRGPKWLEKAVFYQIYPSSYPCVPFIYYGDEIGMISQRGLPSKEGSNERSGEALSAGVSA